MNLWVRVCIASYRRLARAFPHEFRMIYGDDMERVGVDVAPEIWQREGWWGLVRLLGDILARLPAEYFAEFRQDVRYALRSIRKSPAYAATAILSLGVGIGLCTFLFTGLNATVLRPLPGVPNPKGLVVRQAPVSYPEFAQIRERREIASTMAAFIGPVPFGVHAEATATGKAERVLGHIVSAEYFATLGIAPARGRFFDAGLETPGSAPVAVVSERFWQIHLGQDPNVVGRRVRVNGQLTTIIGVGPRDFQGVFPRNPADIFIPATSQASLAPELSGDVIRNPDATSFRILGRLANGVTGSAAEPALNAMVLALRENRRGPDPNRKQLLVQGNLAIAEGMMPLNRAEHYSGTVVYVAMMALIMTLACANIAGIVLARASTRRKEVAIRLSVGASRLRLMRQLLTESVTLAGIGGIFGFGFALGLLRVQSAFTGIRPGELPSNIQMTPDWRVIVFTFALATLAGVVCGLSPALAATRADVGPALKDGAAAPLRGYRRFGLRNGFMVYQVAAALALLLVMGFFLVGTERSVRIDPGFDAANLYVFSLDPTRDGYPARDSRAMFERLRDRLSTNPAVRGVAYSARTPFAEFMDTPSIPIAAPQEGGKADVVSVVSRQQIGAGYFATLGVPVIAGREFTAQDEETDPAPGKVVEPVLVNQRAAHEFFGSSDPLERHLRLGSATLRVIGVTRDTRNALLSGKPTPTVFWPLTKRNFERGSAATGSAMGITVLFRAAGPEGMDVVVQELKAAGPQLTILEPRTMRQHFEQMKVVVQAGTAIYAIIGMFGVLLAGIGLSGVTAHAVTSRRKEIGVRLALGARRRQVLRLVLREGVAMIAVGCALGFGGALALSRALSAMTAQLADAFVLSIGDPIVTLGAPGLLIGLAAIFSYLPASRSTRMDPVSALREE